MSEVVIQNSGAAGGCCGWHGPLPFSKSIIPSMWSYVVRIFQMEKEGLRAIQKPTEFDLCIKKMAVWLSLSLYCLELLPKPLRAEEDLQR